MSDQLAELKGMITSLAHEMRQGFEKAEVHSQQMDSRLERIEASQEKTDKRLSNLERDSDEILGMVQRLAEDVTPLVEQHEEEIKELGQ